MKTIKKITKSIGSLFIMLMMLQSCTAYKSSYITIDKAVQNENVVRIKTKFYEKLKFKKITFENGNFYGVKKIKGENEKALIDTEQIMEIKAKDNIVSTFGTVGLSILGIFVAMLTAFAIGGGGM